MCDTRIFRLEYTPENKIFKLKMEKEKFLSIMEKYFTLKDERNHSNHARQDETGEFDTAKNLQEAMKNEIERIENVERIFINHTNHNSSQWSAEQARWLNLMDA